MATFRVLRGDYGRHNRPTAPIIDKILKKFEETGSVKDLARPAHRRNVRTTVNISSNRESVVDNPNLWIPLPFGSILRFIMA